MARFKFFSKFNQKGGKDRTSTESTSPLKSTKRMKHENLTVQVKGMPSKKYDGKNQLRKRRREELINVSRWYKIIRMCLFISGVISLLFSIFLFDFDFRNFGSASTFRELFRNPVFTRILIIILGVSMVSLSFVPLGKVYRIVRQDIDHELEMLDIEDYYKEAQDLSSQDLTEKEALRQREYFLKCRRKELIKFARWHRWLRRTLMALGVFSLLFSIFVFDLSISNGPFASPSGLFQNPRITRILIFLFGVSMLLLSMVPLRNAFQGERQAIDHELEMIRIGVYSIEARAETLFKQHHLELKRYYDEALSENSWLYKIGVVCLALGFFIIGVTFYFFYIGRFEVESQIIIAILGGVSAIATDLVAAIYIKMHAETIKTLTQFHNRFVNTHHFYFGNFLISKIKNEDKRDDAIVKLAMSIIREGELEPNQEAGGESDTENKKKAADTENKKKAADTEVEK
ncbi:hypothetical protein [Planococcus salinus]|uniref:Uncharacterized protein n=1 Tax=Planococcus salinus TaxID=1848460 RepID=A0A3M8P8M7_9BACL|nr:hypothetical protein [Planococcus salinus]RNF39610.1 hypothetical protein EEX84_09060 [Planococcus salinus]